MEILYLMISQDCTEEFGADNRAKNAIKLAIKKR